LKVSLSISARGFTVSISYERLDWKRFTVIGVMNKIEMARKRKKMNQEKHWALHVNLFMPVQMMSFSIGAFSIFHFFTVNLCFSSLVTLRALRNS